MAPTIAGNYQSLIAAVKLSSPQTSFHKFIKRNLYLTAKNQEVQKRFENPAELIARFRELPLERGYNKLSWAQQVDEYLVMYVLPNLL